MNIRTAAALTAIGLALSLGGCETATPYQPLQRGTAESGGFTDQRLDANHFRVTFQGNTVTPRETVETYLLYRAAELTVSQGYDWFEAVDRHTERDRRTYVDPMYGPGFGPYGFWRPRWRWWGGFGWGPWDYYGGASIDTVQKYEASAEIVMQHGPKPAADARAMDARQVLANLAGRIQRPGEVRR